MALCFFGRYYDSGLVELTSLGNFGRVGVAHSNDGAGVMAAALNATLDGWEREAAVSAAFLADAGAAPATAPFNKAAAVTAMSAIDCVAALAYFAATLALGARARTLARQADVHTVTAHDYSVRVSRLPRDAGAVVRVEVVRAYGRLVRLVLRRGKLLRRLQAATTALQKEAQTWEVVPASREAACYTIKAQIEQLSAEIQASRRRAEQALADSHRVVGAFVTFRHEAGKLACLQAQPHSRMRQWLTLKPQHKLRGRHALDISDAPEPSDVQFENMEHGACSRAARAGLGACAAYSCLAAGFAAISLASATRFNFGKAAGVSAAQCAASCRLTVGGALGLDPADRERYAACAAAGPGLFSLVTGGGGAASGGADPAAGCGAGEDACYRCYCLKAITAGMLEETLFCRGSANLLLLEWGSQAAVVLVILAINSLLSVTSRLLSQFEKHHTRSAEARSLAHKLFLAQARRYKAVGRSLIISQFVAALLRGVTLATRLARRRYRMWRRGRCLTQHQLQKAMRGPRFELDQRYGEHLNVIYVCLLLSGGLPAAYGAAALWFAAAYWCDKYELLTLSRRPTAYGADLSNMVWHVIFALWAFSLFGLPRSGLITQGFAGLMLRVCAAARRVWASTAGMAPEAAAARLLSASAAHLLVALVVLVGVLLIQVSTTTWMRAGRALLSAVGVIADSEGGEASGVPEFGVAVRTQLLVGESSYAIQDQPSYAAAFARDDGVVGDVLVQVVMRTGAEKLTGSRAKPPATPPPQQAASPRAPSELAAGGPACPPSGSLAASAAAALARDAGPQQAAREAGEPRQRRSRASASTASEGWAPGAGERADEPGGSVAAGDVPPGPEPPPAWEQPQPQPQPQPQRAGLSAQYRAARANQVLPLPPEYLAAARAGGAAAPPAADDCGGREDGGSMSLASSSPAPLRSARAALLVTAHPDDEAMFFAPCLHALVRQGTDVRLLCLSNGNGAGLGAVREKELVAAARVLGVPASRVAVLDHPQLQDGMTIAWPPEAVAAAVEAHLRRHPSDTVLTFDAHGVSGHINHRGVHAGVAALLATRGTALGVCAAWQLVSECLAVKFSCAAAVPLAAALARRAPGHALVRGGDVAASVRAMAAHGSQWVWYRKLFVLLSSYTYVNRVAPLEVG
ncbi:Pigl [Scenedesmus sp. PABB004]|nr:Pigl [Scenedesmus sp. PABB004]